MVQPPGSAIGPANVTELVDLTEISVESGEIRAAVDRAGAVHNLLAVQALQIAERLYRAVDVLTAAVERRATEPAGYRLPAKQSDQVR